MKWVSNIRILSLAIGGLVLSPAATQAQTVSDDEVAAYRMGYLDGWRACQSDPGCSDNPRTSGAPGTFAGFELPDSIFPGTGPGTTGRYTLPSDWYVAPSAQGQGVIGRVEGDGQFRPYVVTPSGEIELLSENQLPIWMTDPAIRDVFSSFPKGDEGFVFVPVQPSPE